MHSVCSLCRQVMTEGNAKEFTVPVPEIGKKLTFKACVFCQERAESNKLHICLSCKSISWYPSGNFRPHGISCHVKCQCHNCITEVISQTFPAQGASG
jgi:hypothetical protein